MLADPNEFAPNEKHRIHLFLGPQTGVAAHPPASLNRVRPEGRETKLVRSHCLTRTTFKGRANSDVKKATGVPSGTPVARKVPC